MLLMQQLYHGKYLRMLVILSYQGFLLFYRRMAQLYQQTKLQIVIGVRWQIRHHL